MGSDTKIEIRDIFSDVKDEVIKLPDFQREFKWKQGTMVEFVKSIYKQYPTGTFYFWKTKNKDDQNTTTYLVDGQQRITTISYCLYGALPKFHSGYTPKFSIYFNPFSEKFVTQIPKNEYLEKWIKLTDFFKLSQAQAISSYTNELKKIEKDDSEFSYDPFLIAERLGKLKDIETYTYYIDELPRDIPVLEAVSIFNLINSKGTNLSDGDLAYATVSGRWDGFKKEFITFKQTKMETRGYFFDTYFYMRLLAATTGNYAKIDDSFHEMSKKEIKEGWSKLKKILPYLMNVYNQQLQISRNEFLSNGPLYVTTRFLSNKKSNTFTSDEEQRAWMYFALLAWVHNRYSGSGGDYKLNIDFDKVDGEDNPVPGLVQNISFQKGQLEVHPTQIKGAKVGTKNQFFGLYLISLKSNGGINWKDGEKFYPPEPQKSLHNHHIFPSKLRNEVKEAGGDIEVYDFMANRVILKDTTNWEIGFKEPKNYLPEVLENYPKALDQQYIPYGNKKYWELTSFDEFIDERSKLLANGINNFIRSFGEDIETLPIVDLENLPEEGTQIEYKASFKSDINKTGIGQKILIREVVTTVAAFANSLGGKLLIGVEDDKNIIGISEDLKTVRSDAKNPVDRLKSQIVQSIINGLERQKQFTGFNEDILDLSFNGNIVLLITVDPVTTDPPVYVDGKIYIREGSHSRPLKDDEVTNWLRGRYQI